MILRDIILQVCQVLAVLLLAPLLQGVIQQFEERVQLAQGPGIFQPSGSSATNRLSFRKRPPGFIGSPRSSLLPRC